MKIHFTLFIILLNLVSFAQNEGPRLRTDGTKRERPKIGFIYGKVLDEQTKEPVEYATVALLSSKTGDIVAGNVTSSKGTFSMKEIPVGKYNIKITYIGYENIVIKDIFINKEQSEVDLKKLYLIPAAQTLEEVAVVEERSFIQNKIDKKVINVESMVGYETATVTEILQYAPSVEVDIEGNISLRGSESVRILIDGKPSGLSDDQSSILDQFPANSIESIEIITNPSAKYDPEGIGGIINVILKKNKLKGYNGDMNIGVGTLPNYNAGFNLNYRNQRFNLFGNYNFRYDEREMTGTSYIKNFNGDPLFDQIESGERKGSSHVAKAGMDYFFNENNSIGFYGNIHLRSRERTEDIFYQSFNQLPDSVNSSTRSSVVESNSVSAEYNLNYRHEFLNPKHFLTADINYSDGKRENNDAITADSTDEQQNPLVNTVQQQNLTDNKSDNIIAQLDYTNPINSRILLEAGLKADIRKLNNQVEIANFDSTFNEYIEDTSLSNVFEYDEQIYAAYGIYGHKIGAFTLQGGIRLESALTESRLLTTNETFDNDYFSWFPSFHSMYQPDRTQEFQLNYSRRIKRPSSRQLNPFTTFSDAFRIRTGNPNLLPEYTNSVELGYSKFWTSVKLITSIYYRYTDDPINRVINYDTTTNVTTVTYDNIESESTIGGELSLIASPFKWWNINASVDLRQRTFEGAGETSELSNDAFNWSVRLNQTFKLPADVSIQGFVRYRGPRQFLQGKIEGNFTADLSFKKLILEKKGSLGLRVTDIFDTRKFEINIEENGIVQEISRNRESRAISFTFTYKFGNLQPDKRKRQNGRRDSNGGNGDIDVDF